MVSVINGDGECSTVTASFGRFVVQASPLGAKIAGCSALMLYSSDEL